MTKRVSGKRDFQDAPYLKSIHRCQMAGARLKEHVMKIRHVTCALLGVAAFWAADSMAAQPAYAYQTTVRLAGGNTSLCGVNEPLPNGDAPATLTRREQTQADVLATQRLRLLSGPASDYPSPYTAPTVICSSAG
jgi:hypothetical protein